MKIEDVPAPVLFERRQSAAGFARPAIAFALEDVTESMLARCQRIEAARDPAERLRLLQGQARALGFDAVEVGEVPAGAGATTEVSWSAAAVPSGWSQRYLDQGFAAVDARLAALARSSLPYVWNLRRVALDGAASGAAPERMEAFVAALRDASLHSGLMLVVPSPDATRRRVLGLASRRGDCGWIDDACVGAALMLATACGTMPRASVAVPAAASRIRDALSLTATQRQIASCLRDGMSDKQIAYTLGVTRHNVDYHMRQLRRRFGARNRVQLSQRLGQVAAGVTAA